MKVSEVTNKQKKKKHGIKLQWKSNQIALRNEHSFAQSCYCQYCLESRLFCWSRLIFILFKQIKMDEWEGEAEKNNWSE